MTLRFLVEDKSFSVGMTLRFLVEAKKLLCRNDKKIPRRCKKSFFVGMTLRFLVEAKL
jgi:hypothetical protein